MKSWTPFVGASLLLLAFSVVGEENGSNNDILHEIVHRTRKDANIDISLSKISHEETCNIITPNGETVLAENVNIPGVTVRNSSYFVSCRITIGPINESLLGNWLLCGEYKDKNEPHKRCQPVSISWYNLNNSSQTWNLWSEPKSDYVVSYDGNLSPVLTGSGTVSTCHAVTPNGEELVITADTDYPGLTRVGTNEACNFNIGPINKYYIGDWKLFGLFNSPLMGLNEVSRPMHLFLYDEENPYSQAYNVTNEEPVTYIINLGSTIIEEINGRGNLATDDCQIISSSGQKYSISDSKELDPVVFKDVGSNIACRVAIGPITEEMIGKWNFSGKFSNSDTFTERRRIIEIVKEDPANPIIDENRIVDILDTQFFNTSIGASHTILIKDGNTKESCHLRTPAGLQYTIMEGFNISGIEVIEDDPDVTCGITVNVKSEDLIGEWILIARVSNYFDRIERRLPFIVYVEEIVRAIPQEVIITEGNILYLRLEKPTELKDSCVLYGPNHNLTDFETDRYYNDKCGFIIKDIEKSDDGMWEIRYGMGIKYRAFIDVIVIASWNKTIDNLEFIKDRPIKAIIGPENAIYCKLEDPSGRIVYDNFGKCTLELEKVTKQHNGRWIMTVGFPGKIIAEEYFFNVKITEAERKAIVTTSIEEQKPEVILTCSVPTEYEVKTCKFRKPSGWVLLAVEGVGESGYTFHGVGTSMESAVRIHECGLRIANLQSDDLGIWRCAVETANDTYYGFLTVLYSWAPQDSEVTGPIIIEPNLITTHRSVDVLQGDTVTMSCSIQSAIEYCYFRAQNGTIFNLSPDTFSENVEYVGAGLDAGECGAAFRNLLASDSGRWSCHVGFHDGHQPEQRTDIYVNIKEPIVVRQFMGSRDLIVEGEVYDKRPLDYCRYVRIDGLGFTSLNLPEYYYSFDSLTTGLCSLHIEVPNTFDMQPWTVIARVQGQTTEISAVTNYTKHSSSVPAAVKPYAIWLMLIAVSGILLTLALMLIPENNRRRTSFAASFVRNSFRGSFQKRSLTDSTTEITTSTSTA